MSNVAELDFDFCAEYNSKLLSYNSLVQFGIISHKIITFGPGGGNPNINIQFDNVDNARKWFLQFMFDGEYNSDFDDEFTNAINE